MRKKSQNHIETRGAAGVRAAKDLLESFVIHLRG